MSERKLNSYYVEVEAQDESSEPHEHPGAEIVFVLRGELVINVEGEDYALKKGDAIYFELGAPPQLPAQRPIAMRRRRCRHCMTRRATILDAIAQSDQVGTYPEFLK